MLLTIQVSLVYQWSSFLNNRVSIIPENLHWVVSIISLLTPNTYETPFDVSIRVYSPRPSECKSLQPKSWLGSPTSCPFALCLQKLFFKWEIPLGQDILSEIYIAHHRSAQPSWGSAMGEGFALEWIWESNPPINPQQATQHHLQETSLSTCYRRAAVNPPTRHCQHRKSAWLPFLGCQMLEMWIAQ